MNNVERGEGLAQGLDFDMDGLEGLQHDLERAIKKCPVQARGTLKDLSKEFKQSAKKLANTELKAHKREGDGRKEAIKAKWGSKVIEEGVGMTALVWNSARHFHLVENGHNLVRGGRVVGFVPGKHIMEKTRSEYNGIVPERFQQMVDNVLRGCNLE